MRKGFINILILGIGAVILLGTVFLYAKDKLERDVIAQVSQETQKMGAVIATTSLTDTINTFRTNMNLSVDNINNQLNSISSTIAGYGTMASVNSPAPQTNGGTGTSTLPSNNQFLSSNGNAATWKSLIGSGGITITSSTTSTILSTQGFDTTADYTLTGGWNFSSSTTLGSSTKISASSTVGTTPITTYFSPRLGLLASASAASAVSNLSVSVPFSAYLNVQFLVTGTSNSSGWYMTFNGDTASNYQTRQSFDGAAWGVQPNGVSFASGLSVSGTEMFSANIFNNSGYVKTGSYFQSAGSTSTPSVSNSLIGTGSWRNTTTTINTITFTQQGGGLFNTSTTLYVFGY